MRKFIRIIERKNSKVSHWIWTKSKGLSVVFIDGTVYKSEYSLKELLSSECEGPIKEC